MREKDYKYVRAWCKYSESSVRTIQHRVNFARDMNAPDNAIYYACNQWATVDMIKNESLRSRIEMLALEV